MGDVDEGVVFQDFEDFEVVHGLDERGVLVRVFFAFGCDADLVVVRALGGDYEDDGRGLDEVGEGDGFDECFIHGYLGKGLGLWYLRLDGGGYGVRGCFLFGCEHYHKVFKYVQQSFK